MRKSIFILLAILLAASCASVKDRPWPKVYAKVEVCVPQKICYLEVEDRSDPLNPTVKLRIDTIPAHRLYFLVYAWTFPPSGKLDTLQVFKSEYDDAKIGDPFSEKM